MRLLVFRKRLNVIERKKEKGSMVPSFNADNYDKEQPIIIYGAGQYGELALRGLQALNIKVDYFLDHSRQGEQYLGVSVLDPSEISNYRDANVLIASLNYYGEMVRYLHSVNHTNIYNIADLMQLEYDEDLLSENAKDQKNSYQRYVDVVKHYEDDSLTITHCEIVLTEKCTLKCKDCANFMQYYEHPVDMNLEEIIEDFDKLLDSIDKLLELRLLGGEPFIFKHIDSIINYYARNPKITRITVYTNATLIPSEQVLTALSKDNVAVHMSNYGIYSRNIGVLEKIFLEKGIKYYVHKYENWCDMGDPRQRHKYSNEEVENIYRKCMSKSCHTFYRGKLYICPRQAHGEQLQFFQNKRNEDIDFTGQCDRKEKREEIKNLFADRKYIDACYYCNGLDNDSIDIPAAVQLKRK